MIISTNGLLRKTSRVNLPDTSSLPGNDASLPRRKQCARATPLKASSAEIRYDFLHPNEGSKKLILARETEYPR
jgi:hypothetical protein